MSELRELYQEVILDHNRQPRNRGRVEPADRCLEGYNPLCGDKLTLSMRINNGVVEEVRFDGVGCAISTASASMMTEAIKGRTVEEAQSLFSAFRSMVTEGVTPDLDELGKLAVFSGVVEYPMRVKCATLAWHTLNAALNGEEQAVTTE